MNPSSGADRARTADEEGKRLGRRLAGVFLLLCSILVLGAYAYLSHRQKDARSSAHRELSTVADLKLKQISDWREERLADAQFFSQASFVAQDVRRFLNAPDADLPSARLPLLKWFSLLKDHGRYYGVALFDTQGAPRLALPDSAAEPAPRIAEWIERMRQKRDFILTDLHRDSTNGLIHLDVAFPVFDEPEIEGAPLLGIVVLKIDARHFLFLLIQSWPTPSSTAETLLVRVDGNDVLYLNDLRHRADSALTLRVPLDNPELPAAKVLRGDTAVAAGVDYRGVPVVAAGRLIPGTPWGIVSKMDRTEIYAPLRQQTAITLAALGALLITSALIVTLIWRQRTAGFLYRELAAREQHEREMERMNRLYAALSQVNQAVVRARSREELLHEMCRVLVHFGGCRMAWVGWEDGAGGGLTPLAHYGDGENALPETGLFADRRADGSGQVASATRQGHPWVCNDVLADQRTVCWRDVAARAGWRAMAAFPIRQETHICGALLVCASQKDFFGQQEQALIEEAAGDVSFGLDGLLNDQRRKHAEQEVLRTRDQLAKANADLEHKVAERTAQLAEANTNLEAFAYTAAHDLRSPLRAIRSFCGIVLADCAPGLGSNGQSMMERVIRSAEQMDLLLNDLLAYSTINQSELKLANVSLQKAATEAVALLHSEIQTKAAQVHVDEPMPEVLGHSATLVLLIQNLVSNALKFMPPGVQPQISISAAPATDPSGQFVRLAVQDNGIGIAPENQQIIFRPFERLHGKQAYPGTGLGLAIVRKSAERMGGRAGVESQPGKGSCFWVELPAAQATQ